MSFLSNDVINEYCHWIVFLFWRSSHICIVNAMEGVEAELNVLILEVNLVNVGTDFDVFPMPDSI